MTQPMSILTKIAWNFSPKMRDHAVQAVLIFTSVFLAFALNECRMTSIEKRETRKALAAIVHEMENNLDVLERWAPYHKEVMDRTFQLLETDSAVLTQGRFSLEHLAGDSSSLMREFLTRHAWGYINAQNINFDLQTRIDVIMVYQQQEFVEKSLGRLIELLFSREMLEENQTLENYVLFGQYMGDLWGQEHAMIDTYKFTLERLKE
ncbi:MAG: hypothetical protein EA392_07610 [Cryomorphaceae bacterium]|nr:MAG: hypothetical protein EA392_07610 [Cryomorphaceae bacterium]